MVQMSCTEVLSRTSWILSKEGLLPITAINKKQITKLILHLIWAVFILHLMMHNILNGIRNKDFMLVNRMVYVLMPVMTSIAKSLAVQINRKCLTSLLDDLKSKTFNAHTEEQNRHIQFVDKVSKLMLRYFIITMGLFLSVACFLPIVTNVRVLIPSPYYMGKYEFLYKILHLFIILYMGLNAACFDLLYLSLMGLCVAQLNILEEKLMYLFRDAFAMNSNNLNYYVERFLQESVTLHEMINKFVPKMGTLLSLPIFMQYVCGCLIICSTILQLTIMGETDSTNIISIIAFACVAFFQMAAYHWLGNEIIFKSDKIIESCYLSNWPELNIKSQRSIILLMERAKRPLIIQLYKLVYISLDSLGVIVRWSYSLFALIKARYN